MSKNSGFVTSLLGVYVNFPDGQGTQHQGTIVAAWVVNADDQALSGDVRVQIACTNLTFHTAWLDNCRQGTIPKPQPAAGTTAKVNYREQKKPEVR